jgi:uncharacterized protein (TIGR02266 family)
MAARKPGCSPPASTADQPTVPSGPRRLLLIGDAPSDLLLGQSLMHSRDVRCLAVPTGAEGLRIARYKQPEVVVLGAVVSDLSHGEMCRQLQEDPVTETIPVILMVRPAPHPLPEKPFQGSAVATAPTDIEPEHLLNLVHAVVGTRACRRAHPRVSVALAVDCQFGDRHETARAVNLSEGGMFIAMTTLPEVGAELDLRFSFPSSGALKLTSRVVWRRQPDQQHPYPVGIAVQFLAPAAETRSAIAAFVHTKIPAPPTTV